LKSDISNETEILETQENLFEGGNLVVNDVPAEKIDMTKSGRKEFVKLSLDLFKHINKLYKKKYKKPLWINEKNLDTGKMFNGSTSFIFSPSYKDEDILKHKTKSGDIDLIIPKEAGPNLWNLLESYKNKEIYPNVTYIGNNRTSDNKLGNQINSIFKMEFDNGYKVMAQVDFEMLEVSKEGEPDEFARFSHSSSFEDVTYGMKGVAHKYLIISMAGAATMKSNVYVVTNTSTPEKYKIKVKAGKPMTEFTDAKFSVDKGLRFAYEKQDWEIDGKPVYKEIPTSKSTYEQKLETIFTFLFGKKPSSKELKDMWSFVGLAKLMKKYLNKQQIKKTYDRMFERVWGRMAQELERDNPELDYQIKDTMMKYLEDTFKIKRDTKTVEAYYSKYGTRRKF
jgi:hypothetical protein